MKLTTKLWIALGALILLSPLGLILPAHFRAGSAWGEWSTDELKKMLGYVPQRLQHLSELWPAPMPDYAFKGWEEKGLTHLSLAYIISAIVGATLIVLVISLIGKCLIKKGSDK